MVKKYISEGSLLKMKKKTVIPFVIKAAMCDTLVELATIKSTSKQLQKVQNPNPVTPGLDDSRSLFLSNFGLKPVVGNSGSLDIKPRRASKRLKSQATAPSPPPMDKLHPGKVTSLLCPVCIKSVSPIEVRFHMLRCAP